jgi:hypothetical protein
MNMEMGTWVMDRDIDRDANTIRETDRGMNL